VAVIKHDTHGFEVDVPGTDSYRFRELGAGGRGYLVTVELRVAGQYGTEEPALGELVRQIREPVDLVITEGFKRPGTPRRSRYRAGPGAPSW